MKEISRDQMKGHFVAAAVMLLSIAAAVSMSGTGDFGDAEL